MDGKIYYLNTDLDLTSTDDLTPLAAAFEAAGMWRLYLTREADQLWYARFETTEPHDEPEANIAAMLRIVESLQEPLRSIWTRCSRRQFDIGYDCGSDPWAFNQGLSHDLLGRMAAAGTSLRITLYPDREGHKEPEAAATRLRE
jgi:hypothetical protein